MDHQPENNFLNAEGSFIAPSTPAPFIPPSPISPTIERDVLEPSVSSGILSTLRPNAGKVSVLPVTDPEGLDLDLGYCDYLAADFVVSKDFIGDVRLVYYSTGPGINGAPNAQGEVTIPSALIVRDGQHHSYRLDMGLQPYWRGRLTALELKVDPASVTMFQGSVIQIGDLPNDTYVSNNELPVDDPKLGKWKELESKHFRMVWTLDREAAGFTQTQAHGCLRNAEQVWQFYMKVLHMREPCHSIIAACDRPEKSKINFLNVYNGFWMGGSPHGYGYINVESGGLRVDPPGWIIPHELMHVFEMHQGGHMSGEWWEGYANYGRERWVNYFSPFLFPNTDISGGVASTLEAGFPEIANWTLPHSRDEYLCWPIFLYLDENPDNLPGLGKGDFSPKLWQEAKPGETIFGTLNRLVKGRISTKDLIGLYARRNVTWDYQHQAAMNWNVHISGPGRDPNLGGIKRYCLTGLDQSADDPSWWQVPLDRAPQEGGYTIHELLPTSAGNARVVSVNFHGFRDQSRGADWRASLVIINDKGQQRYSTMWNEGTNYVTLAPNENTLYLVVAATPDPYLYGDFNDEAFPYQSHPQRQRFPFEVQLKGATPREFLNQLPTGLVQHLNGGGWKSATATVDPTVYIGPNARVLDNAKVLGHARIEDFAVIEDNAEVRDHAIVSGHGLVQNNAFIKDFAKVRDWSSVSGGAVVEGQARILEHADVGGSALVGDFATAEGYAIVRRDAPVNSVAGDAVLLGDYMSGRTVLNGFQYGFMPYLGTLQKWIDERKAPPNLFLDYEFEKPDDSFAKDYYGISDGILRGDPKWSQGDPSTSIEMDRKGYLNFDGFNQYVLLPRKALDFHEATFAIWVYPESEIPQQPLFFFGADLDRYFYITANNRFNLPELVLHYKGTELSVKSDFALQPNKWTYIAVSLDGLNANLFIDGKKTSSAACQMSPDQFLGLNIETGRQQNYLGRGIGTQFPFFKGRLDSFRVYSKALSEEEIRNEMARDPTPK